MATKESTRRPVHDMNKCNADDYVLPPSTKPFEEDDPCWGTAEKNDLPYLLSIMEKSQSILYENEEYIALDKPPDLRMDGAFRSTVHKLTSYWYPSNILAKQPDLFKAVETLHKHNYLPDNELRAIHQLDYATSGVLLIGRTRKAAAVASDSFARRQAKKVYLAIVHGHILSNNKNDQLTILEPERLRMMDESEQQYQKSRSSKTQRNGATFVGFLPVNAAFTKWQSLLKEKKRNIEPCDHTEKEKAVQHIKRQRREYKQKTGTVLEPHEFEKLVDECVKLSLEDTEMLLASKWSTVKSRNPRWKQMFRILADKYNGVLKEKNDTIHPPQEPLPRLFRVRGEEQEDAFYIHAACAQLKGQFKMKLHPDALPFDPNLLPSPGDDDLDFKPSLTRCVVLARGYLNDQPVTKVRLEPRTGRRHQLRLHMVIAGNPIVGDISYQNDDNPKNLCSRMCLHAHSLSLNLIGGEKTFVAPDPFLVTEGEGDRRIQFVPMIPGDESEKSKSRGNPKANVVLASTTKA